MRFLIILILVAGISFASEDLVEFDGDLRAVYVEHKYDNNFFPNSRAGAVSAKLSLTTKEWNNLYAKISLTALKGLNHDKNKQAMTYIFAKTWEGKHNSFALLEEAYIGYKNDFASLKIGRQEMATPYIDSDDYFITPNSFEAITLQLKPLKNTSVDLGYVSKMSGTWDSSFDGGNFHSMSRQPWIHYSNGVRDTYPVDEVYNIVGKRGISYLGMSYTQENHKVQLWDFYAHEMFNTIMAQYDYSNEYFDFAIQYSTKRDVGKLKDNPTYRVHYDVYGAKIGSEIVKNWNLTAAYTGVSDDDSLHFFGSWGGFPEFASGMMVSYFETYLRDTNIYSLTSKHYLDSILKGLEIKLKYAYYDLNSNYTVNVGKGSINGEKYMNTYGVQAFYQYNKNLSVKIAYAGRELESNNQSRILRSVLKYKF